MQERGVELVKICRQKPRLQNAGRSVKAVQWGAWHGVGMVAENSAVLRRMRKGGIETISPVMGLSALQTLMGSPVSGPQVVLNCDTASSTLKLL